MAMFRYSPELTARYPNVVGGVIFARDLRNWPASDGLRAAAAAEQAATLRRIGETPLSALPSLAAWRSAFRAFDVDPTQYRCAAEALLRRLTKKGDIPSINTLVDLGNLVSIRYALPVAIFDTRALEPPLTVRFATGTERFTELGAPEAEHPVAGEVIFADETALVYARRWCWRQSNESAAREDTTQALITVEAHDAAARATVRAALDDLLALLGEYAGGDHDDMILDRDHPQAGERETEA
ncbi:MAG TPA: phenylalanine--tRNA ligase beta subunit-related protein [Ktedonobacterales bacterium]